MLLMSPKVQVGAIIGKTRAGGRLFEVRQGLLAQERYRRDDVQFVAWYILLQELIHEGSMLDNAGLQPLQ